MIVANHQPQYLPYLGFFYKIARCDLLVVMDDVQFLQRGHQHRNLIKMQTGTQWLTVPVRQQRGQLIKDVKIDEEQQWARRHWSALRTNYSGASYWKQLAPELEAVLMHKSHTHLWELDLELLQWAMRQLGLAVPMRLSSELRVDGEQSQRHINICNAVGATVYLSGSGGRQYMDLQLFAGAGIDVRFAEFSARPYPQRYPKHGFIPNLSVVDALFNVGPAARDLIA